MINVLSRSWRRRVGRVLTVAVVLAGALLLGHPSGAAAEAAGCTDVTVVFARGSGQRIAQRESAVFLGALSARLGPSVRATAYELGSASYGGARYPAVGVGVDSNDAFANLLDAASLWTGNEGGRYRASVATGVLELRTYLQQRLRTCPAERIVLGGYSQGAQVVGDALPRLSRGVRKRIAFVGLFGDPKLSLPEGAGIFPVGCRGRSLSPWRRGNVGCYTDNGVLDARTPYVPAELAGRTGSWCDRDDPICNNNLGDFLHSSHARYAQPGRAVEQAAREAAAAVRGALGARGRGIDVTVSLRGPAPPTGTTPAPAVPAVAGPRPGPATAAPVADVAPTPSASGSPSVRSEPSPAESPSGRAPESEPGGPAGRDEPSAETGGGGTPPPTTAPGTRPAGRAPAALVVDEYWALPGAPITFDASASALPPSSVTSYRWDFDGDGTTDRTTTTPSVDHTYAEPFTGRVRLRLLAADGAELLAGAPVHVDAVGLGRRLPSGPAAVTVRAAHGRDGAVVRWTRRAGVDGPVDAWRVHDADGRLLAHVPASARQADLTSLPDRTTALTVEAVNEYGSSAPAPAAPRGAGSSRFAVVPAGASAGLPDTGRVGTATGADSGPPDVDRRLADAPEAAEPQVATGLVVTATALLLATGAALAVRIVRTGPFAPGTRQRPVGRHRRSR